MIGVIKKKERLIVVGLLSVVSIAGGLSLHGGAGYVPLGLSISTGLITLGLLYLFAGVADGVGGLETRGGILLSVLGAILLTTVVITIFYSLPSGAYTGQPLEALIEAFGITVGFAPTLGGYLYGHAKAIGDPVVAVGAWLGASLSLVVWIGVRTLTHKIPFGTAYATIFLVVLALGIGVPAYVLARGNIASDIIPPPQQ